MQNSRSSVDAWYSNQRGRRDGSLRLHRLITGEQGGGTDK